MTTLMFSWSSRLQWTCTNSGKYILSKYSPPNTDLDLDTLRISTIHTGARLLFLTRYIVLDYLLWLTISVTALLFSI
jgi:hypothetical protein